jgi:hypothetical protein
MEAEFRVARKLGAYETPQITGPSLPRQIWRTLDERSEISPTSGVGVLAKPIHSTPGFHHHI